MNTDGCPYISVIMVNYNGLSYLQRTIPALLSLDYPDFEFIIIDNGSSDGSIAYIKKHKIIKLIESPRIREKNYACNLGTKEAKGEYILLIDNDSLITDKLLLRKLVDEYNSNGYNGAIHVCFRDENVDLSKSYGNYFGLYYTREIKRINPDYLPLFNGIEMGHPTGQGIFIKKDLYEKLGGYDDNLVFGGDDSDLGIKLWLMGYKVYLFSKTVQLHIGLPERRDNKKYSLKFGEMFYAHLYTITKNYKLHNMIVILFLFTLFTLIKSLKQSIFRLNAGPFISFFAGLYLYFKNIKKALEKRKVIQKSRIIRDDIFLKIKPPDINKTIKLGNE